MANTFSKIYLHIVFTVKQRENLISDDWREELHKYITGIIHNRNQNLIVLNSVSDHLHMLIAIKPNIIVSNLIRDIKNNSSKFINKNGWVSGKFNWQKGFGAFSLGNSQTEKAVAYISNQKSHHQQNSFQEEYMKLLRIYNIDYDDKYVFDR
jgi:REP element-mobilizing transposase RayT